MPDVQILLRSMKGTKPRVVAQGWSDYLHSGSSSRHAVVAAAVVRDAVGEGFRQNRCNCAMWCVHFYVGVLGSDG